MPGQTISGIDAVLKDVFEKVIQKAFNDSSGFFSYLKRDTESALTGKNLRIAMRTGHNTGFGFRSTTASEPPLADREKFDYCIVDAKTAWGRFSIPDYVLEKTKDANSLVNVLTDEMEGLTAGAKRQINRIIVYGDGTGRLAQVSAAVTNSTTIPVTSTPGTKFLEVGMVIDVYNNGTKEVDSRTIVSVGTTSITVDANVTCSANSWIYFEDAKNQEMMGLDKLIDNTGTVQGKDRAACPWMQANVTLNVGTLTESKMQTAIDNAQIRSGEDVTFGLTTHGVRRAFFDLLQSQRRIISPTIELRGGFKTKAIVYTSGDRDIPIQVDRDVRTGTMYLLNENFLAIFQLADFSWLDRDGHILMRVGTAYEGTLRYYGEFGCRNFLPQCVLKGITEG